MIHLAISNYKILTRITNLGSQEAQTKGQLSPLFHSPRAPQDERVLPPY
jgi:hypothetical protein